MRRQLACVAGVLALCAAGPTGCSSDDESVTPAPPRTRLTIVLDRDGDGPHRSREAHVTCPSDSAACRTLDRLDLDSLAPVPADRACTMIYGGPQRASIRGVLRGERVSARFRRTNGCEIARYGRIAPLLDALF